MIDGNMPCSLCQRSDGNIIGPFVKKVQTDESLNVLYFHQECLEANNTTFYSKQKCKWMNIGKAMDKF